MKKYLLPSFLISSLSLLAGCSSVETSPIESFSHFSAGEVIEDGVQFYWLTEWLSRTSSAADYVMMGDKGAYQSDYRWSEGELRELMRTGTHLSAAHGLVPFQIHIRFNKKGEAIYQRYRVNGRILPLQQNQLDNYKMEAKSVVASVRKLSSRGESLIQGHWSDSSGFRSCHDGRKYSVSSLGQMSTMLANGNPPYSDKYYIAFTGQESRYTVQANQLLMTKPNSFECVKRPTLLAE
ncbi:peptidylprolyl isomerase [Vibrio azureus]|uniref:DUF1481 domain-containing protein n=1 Tax=Vibrio azureus NBRC 104587 TaxID=1219077 RepID=U3C875_9VIBR|nr:DUF1481 domain-containing protein [Vibrio azureus]AUI87230.1 peptidylprolyl isomerase [Vibrio azureus]GAD77584.1 hypothetical protein VAZ01S_081_00050 [Vibrio azureus NBRC 104587]